MPVDTPSTIVGDLGRFSFGAVLASEVRAPGYLGTVCWPPLSSPYILHQCALGSLVSFGFLGLTRG